MIQTNDHESVAEKLKDTESVKAALKKAARDAVNEHAREGHKIAVWRNGEVVWEDADYEQATQK